jgi:hypothetical protein
MAAAITEHPHKLHQHHTPSHEQELSQRYKVKHFNFYFKFLQKL